MKFKNDLNFYKKKNSFKNFSFQLFVKFCVKAKNLFFREKFQ